MGALGRRVPPDFEHVLKYGFAAVTPETVATVERILPLPSWHWSHDQGETNSCVGHGSSMERAITNTAQRRRAHIIRPTCRYDTMWLWDQAKIVDGFADTSPGDNEGTTVRAAYDVLRAKGAVRCASMKIANGVPAPRRDKPVSLSEGVKANRWATTVDEVRTAIAHGRPVTIGTTWYSDFDTPVPDGKDMIVAPHGITGRSRGGHCTCLFGASDKKQAFRLKNSWGRNYPLVWLPYDVLDRLLREDGEAALVTDR